MNQPKTRILIIGAGYAGLLATVRLAGKTHRQNVEITLVNAADVFVERLRLHQVAANQTIPQRKIVEMLHGTGVQFVQGYVTHIDPQAHEVSVQAGNGLQRIAYDKLVYALGSTINRDAVPGVRDHAYVLTPSGDKSAVEVRETLPQIATFGGQVLVVGGGATGVEAAVEFKESYPRLKVSLITEGELGEFVRGKAQAHIVKTFKRFGIAVYEHQTVAQVNEGEIVTTSSQTFSFDLCLWAGGFTVPPLARESGLAVNERGQVLVDSYLRSLSHPDIYAAGDSAWPVAYVGAPLRMAAITACIMGAHLADVLSQTVKGKTPKPFSFAYMGQGIGLGRRDGVGFGKTPDDIPQSPMFTGRAGYYLREFFVWLLASMFAIEKRLPGAFYWRGKGRATSKRLIAQWQRESQQSA